MAIIINQTNSGAMTQNYIAARLNASTIPSLQITPNANEFCLCDYICDYEEKVFGKVGGEEYQKDTSAFLYKVYDAADTVVIKLQKNGVDLATITGTTYGLHYPLGSISQQPLYSGVQLDWTKVLNLHGGGYYKIKAEITIFGSTEEVYSHQFRLYPFSEENAHGTVRVQTIQNGDIFSGQFDYTGMMWAQSFRIKGYFGFKKPTIEIDEYQDETRTKQQIQDRIVNEYLLETGLLPSIISNQLIYDNMLANKIYISDYNLFNNEIYRKFEVRISSFDDAKLFRMTPRGLYTFKFTDIKDNIIKRNFK